jgi:hypothetical protein
MTHYVSATTGKRYPARYFSGLSRSEQLAREVELEIRRRSPRPTTSYSDSRAVQKRSSWTQRFRSLYPDAPGDLNSLSVIFSVSRAALKEVFDKGLKAWQTSGSRPGANAHQWAWARVYKFLLIHAGHEAMKPNDPDRYLHA